MALRWHCKLAKSPHVRTSPSAFTSTRDLQPELPNGHATCRGAGVWLHLTGSPRSRPGTCTSNQQSYRDSVGLSPDADAPKPLEWFAATKSQRRSTPTRLKPPPPHLISMSLETIYLIHMSTCHSGKATDAVDATAIKWHCKSRLRQERSLSCFERSMAV